MQALPCRDLSASIAAGRHGLGLNFASRRCRNRLHHVHLNAIIGVDLGTSNSAVAVVGPDGPRVISDADGNASVPSVVSITQVGAMVMLNSHRSYTSFPSLPLSPQHSLETAAAALRRTPPPQDDELLVGWQAALQREHDPENTFHSFKRLMGRK